MPVMHARNTIVLKPQLKTRVNVRVCIPMSEEDDA